MTRLEYGYFVTGRQHLRGNTMNALVICSPMQLRRLLECEKTKESVTLADIVTADRRAICKSYLDPESPVHSTFIKCAGEFVLTPVHKKVWKQFIQRIIDGQSLSLIQPLGEWLTIPRVTQHYYISEHHLYNLKDERV